MKIGHFTKTEDGVFEGRIQTLNLTADIRFVPATDKASDEMPDYRIQLADTEAEIGAAWHKLSQDNKPYLKAKVDDPCLYDTIWPALTRDENGEYSLYWDRPKLRKNANAADQKETL